MRRMSRGDIGSGVANLIEQGFFDRVSRSYTENDEVAADIYSEIERTPKEERGKRWVLICGDSGSGKTTLAEKLVSGEAKRPSEQNLSPASKKQQERGDAPKEKSKPKRNTKPRRQ